MKNEPLIYKYQSKQIEETYRLDSNQLKLYRLWAQFDYLSRDQIDCLWSLIKGSPSRFPNGTFSRGIRNNALFVSKTSSNFHKKMKVYLLSPDLVACMTAAGELSLTEEYTLSHTPNYHDFMLREFVVQSLVKYSDELQSNTLDFSDFQIYYPRQAKDPVRSFYDENYLFISDCRINYCNTEILLEYDNLTKSTVEHSTKMIRYVPYLIDESRRDEKDGNPPRDFKLVFISRDASVSMVSPKSRKIKTMPVTKINKTFDAALSLPASDLTLGRSFRQIVEDMDNFDLFALPAKDAASTLSSMYLDALAEHLTKPTANNLANPMDTVMDNIMDNIEVIKGYEELNSKIPHLIHKMFNIPGVLSAELYDYRDDQLPKQFFHAEGDSSLTNHFDYLLTLREFASDRELYIGLMTGRENSFKTIKDFAVMTVSYLDTYHQRAVSRMQFQEGCSAVPMLVYRPKTKPITPFTVWDFRKIKSLKQIAPHDNPFLQSTLAVPTIINGKLAIEFFEGNSSHPLERKKLSLDSIVT